ncbi:hypothetical protein C2S53_017034 [Perilla frutescens var. hirtella]|uniref:Uncharacterized protein n=1 Tax=Perilla frutescens var. hirtella TaxID=608512 RepID=A0AAD4NZU2_PERFH|nr:hypothetical protein C2S53_017034 [Perilla frutescens var. hirtella]
MAEAAVLFLLQQLSVVLRDERELLGGLNKELQSINDDLVQMRAFLRVADGNEETNTGLKVWVGQLREISFDFEDVLDEYMLRFRRHRSTDELSGCFQKLCALIKNWKARHQIASEIKTIYYRLENVVKNQERYGEMYVTMNQGLISTANAGGDALLLEEDEVVGIEKPKEELLRLIGSMDSGLNVISVVGTGGLGKTTLVKKVFDDESVKSYFDLHVLVVVSDYKDNVKHLLGYLIKRLVGETKKPPPDQELEGMSIHDMKDFIKEFLKNTKYIIVLDDICDLSTWEEIKFSFPRRCGYGCIIITTRIEDIGRAACSETKNVYHLKPLLEEESKVLFFKKAFPINTCPSYLTEIARNILERCEGLPLAIVVIGGLLAIKEHRTEEWELFNRSLNSELQGGSLARLFSLSYNDLPYYLKYCFLYLSIFPEGSLLEKEKILRLWIAEGFVQSEQHKSLEEVAEKYLNELCNRGLIQVARKHFDGRVREFRIHDLLRDFIISKSTEQNIVTLYNGRENQWPNKIRRLAIQNSDSFSVETNNFEHLRSLLLLSNGDIELGTIKELVSKSRLLKVLELRGAPMETIPDGVFKLYHLKHLCLRNTLVKVIPTWIKDLRNLETLDLKNTSVTELPIGILNLKKLRHLLVYRYKYPGKLFKAPFDSMQSCRAPYDIGSHLRSLQKLRCLDADEVDNIKIVNEVGKLTQLKRLSIAKLRSTDGRELCSSIAKLTSLRSLRIDSVEEGEKLDLNYSLSSTGLPFLRLLVLYGRIENVPQWIPSLHDLATLHLRWCKLKVDPLIQLQGLPNLTSLLIHDALVELQGLNFSSQFLKLKKLVLMELRGMKWVKVEKGSLPSLEDWRMYDCKLLEELPRGIEHTTNLQFLGFYNMPKGFRKRVDEEKKTQGDNWRLARVHRVAFGTMKL